MLGRSHIATALCVGVIAVSDKTNAYTLALGVVPVVPVFLLAVVVGALLPDLDHPQSMISRRLPVVGLLVSRLVSHRGLLHSLFFVAVLFASVRLVLDPVALGLPDGVALSVWAGLLVGYLSHIAGDMLTVSGVRLLYPLPVSLGLPLMVTGGIRERVFVLACVAGVGAFFFVV